MAIEVRQEGQRFLIGTVRGLLRKSELDVFQKAAADLIAREKKIRCLIVLDGFEGWERGVDWSDQSFVEQYDEALEKLAVVGPSQHKDDVLMFTVAPLRAGDVQYFPTEPEARAWLGGQ